MRSTWLPIAAAALILAGLAGAGSASAETITLKAVLDSQSEVPPNDSKAKGMAEATYDTATRSLSWVVTFSGLSGPAIGAHIHGPSDPGKNAGIVLPFTFVLSPIKGSATLTETQAEQLLAGKLYVNIHTEKHPGGEIRGQLTK